jgi:uncharacterized protein
MKKVLIKTIPILLLISVFMTNSFSQNETIPGKTEVGTFTVKNLTIVTGSERGSYHQMAKDIKSIYRSPDSVTLIPSFGSLSNFNKMTRDTFVDLAFMQYDVLLNLQKQDMLKKRLRKTDNVRVVLPMGIEEIHLITTKDSKIKSMKDLKEKRVAIGTNTSGTFYTANLIKEIVKGEWFNVEKSFDDAITALLRKEIDAFFFVSAAPVDKLLTAVANIQNFKLIPITEKGLADYYVPATIPKSTYNWMTEDIQTFGVRLLLVTDISHLEETDKYHINAMLEDIKSNMEKLKKEGHNKWKTVDFKFDGINWKLYQGSKDIFGITSE